MNAAMIVITGIIVIFVGIILVIIGTALQSTSQNEEVHTGGVILIGPIPIIFGNDKSLIVGAMIFAVVIIILWYLLVYRGSI
ncbi:TIGR00304 family membrane protein [Methanobacterium sp.]|uniref:TIGR00304 family membrane protein n=1 Tax=Methanobacterium sp. TaxID=2164 RepID=UPI003C73488F